MQTLRPFCPLPFNKIKVDPSGNVSMCCYQKGVLGNLLTQDFREIWWSKLAREIRDATLDSRLHAVCEGWGGCPYLVSPRVPKTISIEHGHPTSLEFDLPNTHCNIGGTSPTPETACFMCPRSSPNFHPLADHSQELADRLKFLMPYLMEIRIQGTAEPFWKDRVFEILERLEFQEYNQKCTFNTYTNGSLLTKERRSRFIKLCPKAALFFSIDAATPETYRKIRRLNLFDRVVDNVRSFVREKSPAQRAEIANNLNLLNLGEAVQMVDLAKELSVDRVQFNPTHDGGEVREDLQEVRVGPHNVEQFSEAQRKIRARAAELGVRVHFVRPLDLNFSIHSNSGIQKSPLVPTKSESADGERVLPRKAPPRFWAA